MPTVPTLSFLIACTGSSDPVTTPEPHNPVTLPVAAPAPATPQPVRPGEPPLGLASSNCEDLADGGPVAGPDCATGRLTCGETVVGHTKGGVDRFDTRFYEKNFCTPATTNHDSGDERAYWFELPPGDRHALIYLDTPCADLDMAALKVEGGETCPGPTPTLQQCEMWPKDRTDREKVRLASRDGSRWLIVVEGKGEAEGPFSLTVTCTDGL